MNLDASTITAVSGGIGVILASVGGIVLASSNKRSEKEDSAKKAIDEATKSFSETRDEAYEARLKVLQEKNDYLERQLSDCKADSHLQIEELTAENDRLRMKYE